MIVAVYCRVSTDEQDAGKQEAELREFCSNRGYEIFRVYVDVISGSKNSRPALNELMIDAYAKRFGAVVIYKLDRLGRSLSHLLDLANKFELWHVHLICTTQPIDTTSPVGKVIFAVLGAIAEFERDLIRERTVAGMKHSPKKHLIGKRGRDKGVRKKGGYYLRYHKPSIEEKANRGGFI